jgi:hypothetical protein
LDLGRRRGQCPRRLLSPRDGGLPLTIDTSPLPALVVVDREMWKKIALNLVSSAFKFTRRGGIAIAMPLGWPRRCRSNRLSKPIL